MAITVTISPLLRLARPATFAAVMLLAACSKGEGPAAATAAASGGASPASVGASGAAAAASAPPVGVSTVRAQQRDMPVLLAATGAVAALQSIDVKSQATSVVTKVHIKEGQFVKAGEPLFTLDARTDEANLGKARAQLAKDEAGLADAQRQLARSRELFAQNFVSQGAVDANQSQVESQTAVIAADKAAIEAARVQVSYARIVAPGAGRAGAINVYPGTAVQANQTTLVSITQLDPIGVAFSLPQRHLADALAALKEGGALVTATLPESGVQLKGRLQFVDNAIDAASGTVKAKASFDNKEGKLWPGAFVTVAMTVRVLKDAIVVPQASIIQSQRGTLVFGVVDGKAVPRPVQLLYSQGDDAVVSGLKPGERVVLDGRQNVRPGVSVVDRGRAASGAASGASGAGRGASGAGGAVRAGSEPGRGASAP